nr:MAG TPA: hypothetical protein [Caudoviricetes sp.]
MVKVYVLLIKCGRRTVEQTPSIWYQDTVDELRKEGWFDEHPEQDPLLTGATKRRGGRYA